MHWIEWIRSRLSGRPDSEHEQALIRVTIMSLIFGYFSTTELGSVTLLAGSYLTVAVLIFIWILLAPTVNVPRRILGMIGDMGGASYGLALAGEVGSPLLALYLWVIVGNGFRYGLKSLLLSTLFAVIGLTSVLIWAPYWSEHLHFGIGLLITLALVPLYMAGLVRKLHQTIQVAEEANRAKSLFLAKMSHELRTPLNGIIGMSDLLTTTSIDKEQKDYISAILSSGHTLLSLIEDTLDISKIEAGKLIAETKPFDLHALVNNTVQAFTAQALGKGLELSCHIKPAVPFRLQGDDLHLRQILINLLSNAIKFTERGNVNVQVDLVDDAPDKRAWICFKVIDTGFGISEQDQKKIFEPFVQADASVKHSSGGTGLGTAIARELVRLMGGRIGLESEVGQGTMFWVELPFERQQFVHKEELAQTMLTDSRVLLYLGDTVGPEVEGFLQRWGVVFETVSGTAQLFSQLVTASEQSMPFRSVIVERALLSMDAEQLADSIKEETTLSDISLILIDSRLNLSDVDRLMTKGYSAVLFAPVNESLLFNAVHEARAEHHLSQGVTSLADYFRERQEMQSSRVLLAEDNEVNQNVLTSILERAGHQVEIASDGEVALDILTERDSDFDIVVLDMNMPNLSGLDVLKAYRFMDTSMKLPVVMLSANALPETIEACRQAGAHDYLTKPVDAKSLVETIDRFTQPVTEGRKDHVDIEPFPTAKSAGAQAWRFIDTRTLKNIQEVSHKPDFLQRLCRQFMDDGTQKLAALRKFSASNDKDAFLAVLHEFKGSAGTLGGESLRKISAEAEHRPQEALDHASMTLLADRLAKVFQGTCRELERYLKLHPH